MDQVIKRIKNYMLELTDIPGEEIRNYFYLWFAFNNNYQNFTFFCVSSKGFPCTEKGLNFKLAFTRKHFDLVQNIREYPKSGILIEGNSTSPPCAKPETVKTFGIRNICNFLANVSDNEAAFLRIMKFSKQNPVYFDEEEEDEFWMMTGNTSSLQGFTRFKKMRTTERVSRIGHDMTSIHYHCSWFISGKI